MDGKAIIARLKRLSEVEKPKDITQLTYALFPGAHCPLFGAMLAIKGIKDAYMLVVGTEECTHYTKATTMNPAFGGIDSRCLSIVLTRHDVTFGAWEKVESVFSQVAEEFAPKAVFLTGTCLTEIIGDDLDALAATLTAAHGIPVLPVHTEHFKTENHLPGVASVLTSCFGLMEKGETKDFVNIIGQRLGDFRRTELCRILTEANIPLGMTLPSGCTIDEIKAGANAKVNVVVDAATGLSLAKAMEKEFGVPYVTFERFTDPENIYDAYTALFSYLKIPPPPQVDQLKKQSLETIAKGENSLKNIRYIYGNTPLSFFEFNAFMVRMGMIPQLLQTAELPELDNKNLQFILKHQNPYVVKSANISPLQYVYDELKPHLYLGHEYAMRLRKKGIAMVRSDNISSMLGFEVTEAIVKELIRASEEARELEAGGNPPMVRGMMGGM